MFFLSLLTFIIFIIILIDFAWNKDIFSPAVLILSNILITFLIPACVKIYTHQPISWLPKTTDHSIIIYYTACFVFLTSFAFGIFYLLFQHIMKDFSFADFELDYKNNFLFWTHQALGIGSFFILLTLLPYNFWYDGAYYHMHGYGIPQILHGLLLFTPGFIFLGAKKHRFWSFLALGMSFILITFLLERGTQSVFMALCAFIVLREAFKISFKHQALIFILLPLCMVTYKFTEMYLSNPTGFQGTLKIFFTYELGRIDFLCGAIFSKLQGFQVDNLTLFRYVPFLNYLPVIKDLNESFQYMPERVLLGGRMSIQGGTPFTSTGETAVLLGTFGSLAIYSVWGIIFGSIYAFVKKSKNIYLIGFYAIFLYSCKGLGLTGLVTVLYSLIFITVFCKFKKSDVSL